MEKQDIICHIDHTLLKQTATWEQTENAIANGADEIDMVINLCWAKDGLYDLVEQEISAVKKACKNHILKVIIETCYLTEQQKKILCQIVSRAGADFIKTSTGFGSGGATTEDIKLFSENIASNVKIKAAGGIKSIADAEQFLKLGAERLGSSSLLGFFEK